MRKRSAIHIHSFLWVLTIFIGIIQTGYAAERSGDQMPAAVSSELERFCYECHGDKKAKKNLRLNQFETIESVLREKRIWDRVLFHLREEQMPPEDADHQPSKEERKALVDRIENLLNDVDWSRYRRPGIEALARLTREDYRNTMRDLVGLDLHAEEGFVQDGEGESGFRNEREGLDIEAVQIGKYLDAAEGVVDGVMALAFRPSSVNQNFVAEEMERSMFDRMKPHKGGMVLANPGQELSADFDFPAEGYYRIELRASVMGKPTVALIRVEDRVVDEVPVTGTEKEQLVHHGLIFVRKGRQRFSVENKNLFPQKQRLPANVAELAVREAKLNHPYFAPFDREDEKIKMARLVFNQQVWKMQEAFEWLRVLGVEGDSREIDRFRGYAINREKGLAKARKDLAKAMGMQSSELESRWENDNRERLSDNEQLLEQVKEVQWDDWMDYQGKIFLGSMKIVGPVFPGKDGAASALNTDSNLLGQLKEWGGSDEASIDLLKSFLPLAFRRKVEHVEVDRFIKRYRDYRQKGEKPEGALRLILMAVLTAPEFIFREERVDSRQEDDVEALDSWSLASRLSYFLWSTMPDGELFELAGSGQLKKDSVLQQQADRMLEDGRAISFFKSFAGQWLGIDSLGDSVSPDAARFPEFTQELGEVMKEEAVAYIESIFIENRSLTELIDSEWTFLNEALADHYGIDGVRGKKLQRIKIEDRRRGGLLGMGSVLTVTSSPGRTNPMRRGFWVLEGLLGDQLGEPPGDAGELPGNAGETRGKTLREEIELHRTRKICMSCHIKLDPIGFGLQNYDAIGRWRDTEAGKPVDSSGVMPDGRSFDGPVELKQVLLERKDEVVKNLCARMLSYALGRKLEYFDEAEVQNIFEQVKNDEYRARALIRAVVSSYPYRYRDSPQQ